jgi:hypothetical protein
MPGHGRGAFGNRIPALPTVSLEDIVCKQRLLQDFIEKRWERLPGQMAASVVEDLRRIETLA